MPRTRRSSDAALKELRAFGLAYPGAHTKSPWPGHLDLAVNDKTFAYLSLEGEPFGISCKLPRSSDVALMLPFAKPTGYGLGKSGWVSARSPPATRRRSTCSRSGSTRATARRRRRSWCSQLDGGAPAAAPVSAARSAKSVRAARPAPKSPRKPSVSGTKKRARR